MDGQIVMSREDPIAVGTDDCLITAVGDRWWHFFKFQKHVHVKRKVIVFFEYGTRVGGHFAHVIGVLSRRYSRSLHVFRSAVFAEHLAGKSVE